MKHNIEHIAKKLFFKYDGSQFYMSRDGVDTEYLNYHISKNTEASWLEELTNIRLRGINSAGNWQVIYFLNHHEDYRHFGTVLNAQPQGKLWEKCAFLETLLTYICNCTKSGGIETLDMNHIFESIVSHCARIMRFARSDSSRKRIKDIINRAQKQRWIK